MGSRRRVGFVLSHEQFAPPDLVDIGAAAEAAGFDEVWASDHFHPWQDNQGHGGNAWVTLGALAARTNSLVLGTGVTCATYRVHPATVAQMFATLATLAPGRVFLGLGTGEAVNEIPAGGGFGSYADRASRLREAIGLIRRLWSDDWVTSDGPHFPLGPAHLYDKPPAPIPILVAAGGPRSARLAGEIADGWIADAGTMLLPQRQAIRDAFWDGVAASGRDRDDVDIYVEQYAAVGSPRDEDVLDAARLWQFLPIAGDMLGESDPRRIQARAFEASSPERVLRRWLVSPDPADHVRRIEELFSAGATGVFVHTPQRDQEMVLATYGGQVLPSVKP
jgi:F420-dependent hydroxymycolic acid dehydrogenase